MKTICLAHTKGRDGVILIARYAPPSFKVSDDGPFHRPALAPSEVALRRFKAAMKDNPPAWEVERLQDEFRRAYLDDVLRPLARRGLTRWAKGLEDLTDPHEPLLACFEKPGEFCHRRLLADFLGQEIGLIVPEDDTRPRQGDLLSVPVREPAPLIPPDRERCQAFLPQGPTFMYLGPPPPPERCPARPTVIVTECAPSPKDGQRGSMSLCPACFERFSKAFGPGHATVEHLGGTTTSGSQR